MDSLSDHTPVILNNSGSVCNIFGHRLLGVTKPEASTKSREH